MIPPTKNNLPAMEVLSMMQKAIRRGQERQAMEAAVELIHTSKAFHTMTCNRLLVTSYEDIDTIAQPWLVPLVATFVDQAMAWYDPVKIGKSRMAIGTAIRAMSRAAKSREGDHFAIAVGLASEVGGFVPTIPDHAFDMHTLKGKAMGRGLQHFREEGAKLIPPVKPDQYESEAYRMLELKQRNVKRDLFDE
jgi:hypothetical protein